MTETIKMAEECLNDMVDSWLAREKDLSKYHGTYSESSLTVNDTVLLIESRQRFKEKRRMTDPVTASGTFSINTSIGKPYWKCPSCGTKVHLNQQDGYDIVCPECSLRGEIMVKWEDENESK